MYPKYEGGEGGFQNVNNGQSLLDVSEIAPAVDIFFRGSRLYTHECANDFFARACFSGGEM